MQRCAFLGNAWLLRSDGSFYAALILPPTDTRVHSLHGRGYAAMQSLLGPMLVRCHYLFKEGFGKKRRNRIAHLLLLEADRAAEIIRIWEGLQACRLANR